MTTTPTAKKKNMKSQAERIAEFGSVSLKRTAKACIPSKDNIDAIAKLEAEIAETEAALATLPDAAKHFVARGLDGMKYKAAMLRANIGNPANLSERDRFMLALAAKLLLKYGIADILSIAVFVESNADKFPVKGTKY